MISDDFHELAERHGFYFCVEKEGHGICAVSRFSFTCGLVTQLELSEDEHHYARRYCYPNWPAAISALFAWKGEHDPPGPWIKEKVSERLGPGADVSDEERVAHERRRQARWDAYRRGDLGD